MNQSAHGAAVADTRPSQFGKRPLTAFTAREQTACVNSEDRPLFGLGGLYRVAVPILEECVDDAGSHAVGGLE